jgi:hypothetical protein
VKDEMEETEIHRELIRKIKGRDHLWDLGTEESRVLKPIGLWSGFVWLMTRANGTSCHRGNESLSSKLAWKFLEDFVLLEYDNVYCGSRRDVLSPPTK